MSINYRVDVINTSGSVTAVIDNPLDLQLTIKASGKGTAKLTLSGFDTSLIQEFGPDVLLDVWRVNYQRGGVWRRVGTFIHKTPSLELTGAGRRIFISYAPSLEELLDASVIAYVNLPNVQKSGQLTTIMREYVNENATANATTANGRMVDHVFPLTLAADPAIGGVWTGDRNQKRLLEVLEELVAWGYEQGQRIDFRITKDTGYNFVFECGNIGTDYTATGISTLTGKNAAGNSPIVLSPYLQNVSAFYQSNSRYNEATRVIALGQGQYDARQFRVADSPSGLVSPVAMREMFAGANTVDNGNLLQEVAEARLRQLRARKTITLTPDPQIFSLFDDYDVGDFLTVEDFDNVRTSQRIAAATISVSTGKTVEAVSLRTEEVV